MNGSESAPEIMPELSAAAHKIDIKKLEKEILSVKKNPVKASKDLKTEVNKQNTQNQSEFSEAKLNIPLKPSQTLVKRQGSSQINNQKTLKNDDSKIKILIIILIVA